MGKLQKKIRKKIILVAEDDKAISRAILHVLRNAGYSGVPILDGPKVVARMKQVLPDLLLLDVGMPGADGHEMCIELKKNKLVSHIPIILMSAHSNVRSMAKRACANDFIAKPFDMFDLLRKIKKNLAYAKRLKVKA